MSDEDLGNPVKVAEAKEAVRLSRKLMLRAYKYADPEFTKIVLLSVVNDDSGKVLVLYGKELIEHTTTFINFPIAD